MLLVLNDLSLTLESIAITCSIDLTLGPVFFSFLKEQV